MKTIYIVESIKGGYEDTTWNNIKAFSKKEDADKYKDRISELFQRAGEYYHEKYTDLSAIGVDDDYSFSLWEIYMNRMDTYYRVSFYVSELTRIQ